MTIRIIRGRPGSWYEHERGKEYESSEIISGLGYVCDEKTELADGKLIKKKFVNFEDAKILSNKRRRNNNVRSVQTVRTGCEIQEEKIIAEVHCK